MILTYFLSPGFMMLAWQWVAARSSAVITRCIVQLAVFLQERCVDGVRVLLRELLSSQLRLRVSVAPSLSVVAVMLRERSPEVRVPRLVSASVTRA